MTARPATPPAPADAAAAPQALLTAASLAAAVLPTLLAYNLPPSATMINQCLAVGLWGGFVMLLAPGAAAPGGRPGRGSAWLLLAAIGLVALAAFGSWAWGSLPFSLAMGSLGVLLGAAVMAGAGADAARRADAPVLWAMFAGGLLAAGLLSSVVALVQVFAPELADGRWIAHSGLPGRAVGNLRQPNHLCSLLLWAVVAAVSLHELRRLSGALLWAAVLLLVFSVELSASRTGAFGLLLLLGWGLVDRRLSRTARRVLIAAPVLYLLSYAAMGAYGHWSQQAIGAGARLAHAAAEAESPNSRLNIWRNAWALVMRHPLTGVGWGEFNFAWSLTPFPGRPTAFFDHTHDLPLQLMVELGLPLSLTVLGLMALALLRAGQRAVQAPDERGLAARAALVAVLMIGLHSIVEYPLWYSYFLLPAAFAWGFALGGGAPAAEPQATAAPRERPLPRWGAVAGMVMAMSGAAALLDYRHAVVIYAPFEGDGSSLEERVARGQRSPLFAHHADYAAATTDGMPEPMRALGLLRATHNLLDTRLMIAWAKHLAAAGRLDEARALADRLREFGHADAEAFFAPCEPPEAGAARAPASAASDAASAVAFQCQGARAAPDWRRYALPDAPASAGASASASASH